jgi:hypothetical protein
MFSKSWEIPLPNFRSLYLWDFAYTFPSIRSTWQSLILVPIIPFLFPIKTQNHIWYAFYRKWCRWGVLIVPTGVTSYWSAERAAPRVAASISCLQAALGNKESHRLSLFLTSALTGSDNCLQSGRSPTSRPCGGWGHLYKYRNWTKGNKWCFLNCLGF